MSLPLVSILLRNVVLSRPRAVASRCLCNTRLNLYPFGARIRSNLSKAHKSTSSRTRETLPHRRSPPRPKRPGNDLPIRRTQNPQHNPSLNVGKGGRSILVTTGLIGIVVGGYVLYGLTWRENSSVASSTGGFALDTETFKPYTLIRKERVSPTSAILTLRPVGYREGSTDAYTEYWTKGVWSVEIKQPQMQIVRRYTPLPPLVQRVEPGKGDQPGSIEDAESGGGDIRILVRREPEGEVSRYLHLLPVGVEVDVRGGYVEYDLNSKDQPGQNVADVVFLAGGTGIAPALQIAHFLKMEDANLTKARRRMQLLWANRAGDDCKGGISDVQDEPWWSGIWKWTLSLSGQTSDRVEEKSEIVTLLNMLQRSSSDGDDSFALSVRYFVDQQNTFITRRDISRALLSMTEAGIDHTTHRRLLLVSGPDGFVEYIAGTKMVRNGIEIQGPIGGLLSQIDLKDWELWKL